MYFLGWQLVLIVQFCLVARTLQFCNNIEVTLSSSVFKCMYIVLVHGGILSICKTLLLIQSQFNHAVPLGLRSYTNDIFIMNQILPIKKKIITLTPQTSFMNGI